MADLIPRARQLEALGALLNRSPVGAILGPRQCGKTTLARDFAKRHPGPVSVFDLESSIDLARLEDPMLALGKQEGLTVLDEIQLRPELFPTLRVLVDRPGSRARFLALGSASPELLRQSSETLAGRIGFLRLEGFALDEVGAMRRDELWLRGGFPRSFLGTTLAESAAWRRDFVSTFLERDLPQLGIGIAAPTLRRFWTMLAHYHAQVWNGAELARAFGVADTTVRRYLDTLTATFVVRQLQPWHENLGKRQVKSPKVFLADSGILHTLLGIETMDELEVHPKIGASFEGFAIDAIRTRLGARPEECYFWATYSGAELDLLVIRGRRRLGFEIKRSVAPRVTPSMRTALEDLKLERLDVVHAGDETFPLGENLRALSLGSVLSDLQPL